MKRAWYREIIRRRVFVILLLLLQVAFIVFVFKSDRPIAGYLSSILHAIGIYLAVYVIYNPDHTNSTTGWVFLLLLFPVAGALLYLLFHFQASTKSLSKDITRIENESRPLFERHQDAFEQAKNTFPEFRNQFHYLQKHMGYPIYNQTEVSYYSPGEEFMPAFLAALESAEHYIFLEYFIISKGEMWGQILDVLKKKAAQGVEVRVMYDDIGCFVTLPKGYAKTLEGYGIKCSVFNPFRPILSTIQNNRDHRKIASIDGKVAFTGGLNLADEYINLYEKYGHWKDCAIRVEGMAAWSLTLMFLQMWSISRKEDEEFERFFPELAVLPKTDGFVQPYADSPMDNETVGEQVYLQVINSANDYLYITTPYLIIDEKMVNALTAAAKSGVDVRIITPHIWDKALVHATTRSFYRSLIKEGVRIYEYTPGYIHSKNFVADDRIATVGTINLDYRSLFLHFECGVLMCGNKAIGEVKKDFLDTLEKCHEMTAEECRSNLFVRLFQELLRLFAPLL